MAVLDVAVPISAMPVDTEQPTTAARPKFGKILLLAGSHTANDAYTNMLPPLLPLLMPQLGFGVALAGLLSATSSVTNSMLQPIFGYITDRYAVRWFVAGGLALMAIPTSLIGLAPSYGILLALIALSGLGSSAFHPQGATMVSGISGARKGFSMSIFFVGGNVGFAIMPIIAVVFVGRLGLHATPLLMLPGLLIVGLLTLLAPPNPRRANVQPLSGAQLLAFWKPMAPVMIVAACRTATYTGLVTFLALYLRDRGGSAEGAAALVFAMLMAGAVGGLCGGQLSDHYGRKRVLVLSLIAATPLFVGFLHTSGPLSVALLMLAGFMVQQSFSITTVVAQHMMPGNVGMASGLTLGFAFGLGGVSTFVFGVIGQFAGLGTALHALVFLPWLGALAGLAIPMAIAGSLLRGDTPAMPAHSQ
jgi:MFS transporter, FSR family, fosmidomycin resistance protein